MGLCGALSGRPLEGEKAAFCGVAAGRSPAATPQKALFPPRSRSGMWASPGSGKGRSGRIRIDIISE